MLRGLSWILLFFHSVKLFVCKCKIELISIICRLHVVQLVSVGPLFLQYSILNERKNSLTVPKIFIFPSQICANK